MKKDLGYFTYIVACLRNKPGRNLATAFCFAFIAANIFSGQYLFSGASGGLGQGVSRMGADIIVVHPAYLAYLQGAGPNNTVALVRSEANIYRFNRDAMDRIGNIPGIRTMSPQLFVSTMNMPKLAPKPVDIFGFEPATDFTIQPWLERPLDHPLRQGEIILGHELVGNISSKISIYGHVYTIAGKLDPTQSRTDYTIFLGMDDAYELAGTPGILPPSAVPIQEGYVNAVLVRVSPDYNPDNVIRGIKGAFSIQELTAFGRHFSIDPIAQEIKGLPDLFSLISAVVIVAAFPLIGLIAAMVAHEREMEIGILRSMGAKKRTIIFLVMAESLSLAAIGGLAGVLASFSIILLLASTGILSSALQVSIQFPAPLEIGMMAASALVIVIAIGTLASLYPAYRSSSISPYDAIRKEGN